MQVQHSASLPHRASMLLPFAGNLRAVILAPFQCFCILSPRTCELEHQSTLLGIVRLCSSAEAFLRMIFIHLSQSSHGKPLNTVPLITWYQDAAFRFVAHPTNERKNFWFAQESWAAAELTPPRQAQVPWVQQQVYRPTRNRGTKRRLIRLRPT